MDEQEKNMTQQKESMDKPGEGVAMDPKMMILMILGCLAAPLLSLFIPAGWLGAGIGGFGFIGIALAVVFLFACCIPMMKMVMGGSKQQNDKT